MAEPSVQEISTEAVEQRRKKRRRKQRRRRITVIVILLIGATIGMMFTPIFNLETIELIGNDKVTRDEVVKKGDITPGKNIFALNIKKIGEGISKIPYVNTIEVKRKLPDKLIVDITECIPAAYMKTKKGCAVIDNTGKILETSNEKGGYPIPEIQGMVSETYKPLEKISVKEQENFQKTLEILRDLYNNNFIDVITSVSVSENRIVLKKSDALIIEMGSYEQFNAKIVMVKEVLAGLPADAVGTLDASNADRVYYDNTNPLEPVKEEEPPAQEEVSSENSGEVEKPATENVENIENSAETPAE